MRLWSLHPRYLDGKGLVALWREALLAQKVLAGETTGYRNHPQLVRFRDQPSPVAAISAYLEIVWTQGDERGYRFDRNKIGKSDGTITPIPVSEGQLRYELLHLLARMESRKARELEHLRAIYLPDPHPSFSVVRGPIADWERPKDYS